MAKSQYDPARRLPLSLGEPLDDPPIRPVRVLASRLTFWLASDWICEAVVHYLHPRTRGCVAVHGEGPCLLCQAHLPRRKTWWLQVCSEEGPDATAHMLELTANALRSEPHLVGSDGSLWGRRITVWRFPGGPKDPMYAELDMDSSPKDLPRIKPTLEILIRMWQARTRAETQHRYASAGDGKSLGGNEEERPCR